jgi:hypothetical protein
MTMSTPGDGTTPPATTDPTPPAPVLSPEDQVTADAKALGSLHLAYDAARDALTAAKAAHMTVAEQASADVAAAQAAADQKVAAAQAAVDTAQANADAAHKAVADEITQLLKDVQGLD